MPTDLVLELTQWLELLPSPTHFHDPMIFKPLEFDCMSKKGNL